MGMLQTLGKLYSLGISGSLNTYDICKLHIINRLATLCIVLDLTLVILNIIFNNYTGLAVDVTALFLVLIPVLWLNYKRHYNWAIYVFLLGFHAAVIVGTYFAIVEGRANEVENLLIPGAIAIIILLQGYGQYVWFIVNFLSLVVLNYFRFDFADRPIAVEFYQLMSMIIIGYIGIYYFIMHFKTQLIQALEKTEKLNAELTNKEQALKESNKSKDRLFSIVAHDLRSPLNLIQSLLDPAMIKALDKDKFLEYQSDVRSRIGVLQETMNNLLGWAQSQLGSFTIKPEMVVLDGEVHNVVDLFADMSKSKQINVEVHSDKELQAFVDKNHLNVIVRNVIHNAIKFTPIGGEVKVLIGSPEDFACIAVTDSGSGMDAKTKEKILNSQLLESGMGTEGERGSGVGLSFCQDLLKKNHGTLRILNGQAKGSTFEICLPLSKPD